MQFKKKMILVKEKEKEEQINAERFLLNANAVIPSTSKQATRRHNSMYKEDYDEELLTYDYYSALPFLEKIVQNSNCLDNLKNLVTLQNNLIGSVEEINGWTTLKDAVNLDQLKTFIEALVYLSDYDCFNECPHLSKEKKLMCIQLAIIAARTYTVLLTVPNANTENVFNQSLFSKCLIPLKLLETVRKLMDKDLNEIIQEQISAFLNEIKLFINNYSLEEHPETFRLILTQVTYLIYFNSTEGYNTKCTYNKQFYSYFPTVVVLI